MRTRARLFLTLLALTLAPAAARAYPQFQFGTDATRCTLCHLAPAGGGLLNGYGRDESADTISRGGDGRFLHGWWKLPSWLKLGGDVRSAMLLNDAGNHDGDGPEFAWFPMQLDLYSRFEFTKKLSFNMIVGARGSVRPREPSLLSYAVSREHYLTWRPQSRGYYLRAGRFFAPFGLRLPDHTMYVRRYTGFHTLEETYNLSVGWLQDAWEAHFTAFMPDFLRPLGQKGGKGLAAYVERRIDDRSSLAMQARASLGDLDDRYLVGLVGKRAFRNRKLLLMGEVDLMRQELDALPDGRTQYVAHLGAYYWLKRGWQVSATVERYDEDIAVKHVARDAISANLQWFPRAHFELHLLARTRILGAGDGGDNANLAMLQLHYYP